MKIRLLFQLLFCFIILPGVMAQEAVWTPVDPGGSGWLNTAYIHAASGDLYFSSDMNFSLLRSTDKAASWLPIGNPVVGTVHGMAGDPQNGNVIYANQVCVVKENTGIWKSKDKGNTWQQICNNESFGTGRGQSGIVDPDNNKILYWTNINMGVLQSMDGGSTWRDISKGLPLENLKQDRHLNCLEIEIVNSFKNRVIYYPTNVGLYVKSGFNKKWEIIKNGLPESNCTQVAVCSGSVIYAAFPDAGLFKSNDGGISWKRLSAGLDGNNPLRVVATKSNSNIVYVATAQDKGVYGSRNGGETFTLLTHRRFNEDYNWPMNFRQHEAVSGMIMFIDPADPDIVYMDYNKMTFDGGHTWQHYGTKEMHKDRWTGTGLSLLTEYRAVFDPSRAGIVWLGFSDTGLMLSEDNGETIINSITFHRGEVNQAAGIRDRLVSSSGSCQAIAVDPLRSTTIYASISMKESRNRASAGGTVIKSVDGGWNWDPISQENGLEDGIVKSIVIDPSSPVHGRTVYVASYGNGIYKSYDDGNSFKQVTPSDLFNGNTRIMDLEISNSSPNVLYCGIGGSKGIRPISNGPDVYPSLTPGMYGGILKTEDRGETWIKCNSTREIPNVQDIAIHPSDEKIVYAAAWTEDFLLQNNNNKSEWSKGGVYRSLDGGINWELIFESPVDKIHGQGQTIGICINPVAPEIMYAVVQYFGIYRTIDSGKTWDLVGKNSMDRMQRRYHSITVNPHNPAEVWVAHFGNSFSKTIDPVAKKYLENKFADSNFVRNGSFEDPGKMDFPEFWEKDQPPMPEGEKEVISVETEIVKDKKHSVRFHLTKAYVESPSHYPADIAQIKMQEEGKIPVDTAWMASRRPGETRSWIFQSIDPYFSSLVRGKPIEISMDVFIKDRNLQSWWDRGTETGEVRQDPPQLFLTEIRDYNVHWMVAETAIEDLKLDPGNIKGKWLHVKSTGTVSKDALGSAHYFNRDRNLFRSDGHLR